MDTIYLDNNSVTKVAQSLDNNPIAKQLDAFMFQGIFVTTRGFHNSMACGQSNDPII